MDRVKRVINNKLLDPEEIPERTDKRIYLISWLIVGAAALGYGIYCGIKSANSYNSPGATIEILPNQPPFPYFAVCFESPVATSYAGAVYYPHDNNDDNYTTLNYEQFNYSMNSQCDDCVCFQFNVRKNDITTTTGYINIYASSEYDLDKAERTVAYLLVSPKSDGKMKSDMSDDAYDVLNLPSGMFTDASWSVNQQVVTYQWVPEKTRTHTSYQLTQQVETLSRNAGKYLVQSLKGVTTGAITATDSSILPCISGDTMHDLLGETYMTIPMETLNSNYTALNDTEKDALCCQACRSYDTCEFWTWDTTSGDTCNLKYAYTDVDDSATTVRGNFIKECNGGSNDGTPCSIDNSTGFCYDNTGNGNYVCGYACKNSTQHIPLYWLCDSYPDCPEKDDESPATCHNLLTCPNSNRVYSPDQKCNGVSDCPDNADEGNCSTLPIIVSATLSPYTPYVQVVKSSVTFGWDVAFAAFKSVTEIAIMVIGFLFPAMYLSSPEPKRFRFLRPASPPPAELEIASPSRKDEVEMQSFDSKDESRKKTEVQPKSEESTAKKEPVKEKENPKEESKKEEVQKLLDFEEPITKEEEGEGEGNTSPTSTKNEEPVFTSTKDESV